MAIPLDPAVKTATPDIGRATPASAPLEMPTQSLDVAPDVAPIRQDWRVYAARLVAFGGAAALTVYGGREMLGVFGNEEITLLQGLLLCLFTVTFGWIALSATQAVAALFDTARDTGRDQPLTGRTAIIMPVYNEDPGMTCAALQAMGEGLAELGESKHFEIFILSDTTDPTVWVRETASFGRLRAALGARMAVWYRRRPANTGRKAGNLRDFVERWGGRYEQMLVLDADSVMAPETIVAMVRRMQAAPRLGILQTVPVLRGGTTLFARVQQFAGRVYGPVIARGVSAWQGLDGNYWGHNALIRVRAFADCCGLPELPGRMPFGGHVLSHDFVEAALIRRGGWEVRMDADLGGSWEGTPQTLLDLAARDRRWAQGNLQHSKILAARGLSMSNRAHFLIGIGSYLMSPIWLALLITGAALTAQSLIFGREYFGDGPQLFPNWPVFDASRMMWLLALSALLLFLPKIVGLIRALVLPDLRRAFGGGPSLVAGGVMEILLSALFAPMLMIFQAHQVFEILSGRDSGWSAQSRDAEHMPWSTAIAHHWHHVALGTAVGAAVLWFAPAQLIWLSPVLLGLLAAPVLSRQSGRPAELPLFAHLSIPEDLHPPTVCRRADELEATYAEDVALHPEDLLCRPAAMAVHLASGPSRPPVEGIDVAVVTARAKIDAADTGAAALALLDKTETIALLGEPELLQLAASKDRPGKGLVRTA